MNLILKRSANLSLSFFVLSFVLTPEVRGGSASATLGVSVTVNKNCSVSTTPPASRTYDPTIANARNPQDGVGTVTISCTRGAAATIGIGASNGTAREASSGFNRVSYEIYRDLSRAGVWGNSGTGLLDSGIAPNRSPRSSTMNGRVPAGQDVPAGSYSDTITATVNF